MFDGQVETGTRAFRLDRRRNVAIARRDGAAVVGRSVGPGRERSLIVPAAHQAGRFRWLSCAVRVTAAPVWVARGNRMALRLDVPGDYLSR